MANNDRNITIEDAQIAFRNFSGKEDKYNAAGKRNFVVILQPALAEKLIADGWNIKHLKARDEGDTPTPYVHVSINYENRPPKVVMITKRGKTFLSQDEIELLDWADFHTVDVELNPYDWDVNGNRGTKAYLKSFYVRVVEDYLGEKWDLWIEDQKALAVGPDRLGIEGVPDYIEGELV